MDKALKIALNKMILSASGWRTVFAADGNEESTTTDLKEEHILLCHAIGFVFSDFLKITLKEGQAVILGRDSRPTGSKIGSIICSVLSAQNFKLEWLDVVCAPEIMAYTKVNDHAGAFLYISASHNPLGHNGIKFGKGDGAVLGGSEAEEIIEQFRNLIHTDALSPLMNTYGMQMKSYALPLSSDNKNKAWQSYLNFTRELSGLDNEETISAMKNSMVTRPMGIVADLNGSARCLSPEETYLTELGVKYFSFNNETGNVIHRIVPEGRSLGFVRDMLKEKHKEDASFVLGYMPDNDGDRGNIVYFDDKDGKAKILEAQEVFALSVLSEMTALAVSGEEMSNVAVAVNGPTSLRIDVICEAFGSWAFRAEVGEANVVGLARRLRNQGFIVRILGEGSNGGNITHPATVRDPLNTLTALIKLLSEKELFKLWCRKSNQIEKYHNDYSLQDILETLPEYTSTSAYEDRAIMHIKSLNQSKLKLAFEDQFLAEWNEKRKELSAKWGIESWEELNTEGLDEKEGFGPEMRTGEEKGGLKILFRNSDKEAVSYIWMRGSGTEPVFRVLADVKGRDKAQEDYLLCWLKSMIEKADSAVLS